jgi:hypothetical protein
VWNLTAQKVIASCLELLLWSQFKPLLDFAIRSILSFIDDMQELLCGDDAASQYKKLSINAFAVLET